MSTSAATFSHSPLVVAWETYLRMLRSLASISCSPRRLRIVTAAIVDAPSGPLTFYVALPRPTATSLLNWGQRRRDASELVGEPGERLGLTDERFIVGRAYREQDRFISALLTAVTPADRTRLSGLGSAP